MKYIEIESVEQYISLSENKLKFEFYVFQNIDFESIVDNTLNRFFKDCLFLGCNLSPKQVTKLFSDNYIFPQLNVPFNCYPSFLYNRQNLYNNYIVGKPETYIKTYDNQVYQHYLKNGKEARSINETLARRLHDHAITDAMYDFIAQYDEKKIVAIMGGHALLRTDTFYREISLLAKQLCEKGYLLVTGGGPGAMEATHLGTWFAGRSINELEDALKILKKTPDFRHDNWLDSAFQIIENYPQNYAFESLGIPTWLYGHEPATPFATKIAKYFANSIREDGLLTIAKGGVIFTPGSAGTVQEIFQDATQNHYLSFGYASPMIFMGKEFWVNELSVYPFLEKSMANGKYKNLLLSIFNNTDEIINELKAFI